MWKDVYRECHTTCNYTKDVYKAGLVHHCSSTIELVNVFPVKETNTCPLNMYLSNMQEEKESKQNNGILSKDVRKMQYEHLIKQLLLVKWINFRLKWHILR